MPGSIARLAHVCDPGIRCRESRACDRRDKSAHEEPDQGRSQGDQNVVESERGKGDQEYGPTPEAVAQVAENRSRKELDNGEEKHQRTAEASSRGEALTRQLRNQLRHDRSDHPEPDRIDQDRDENEVDGMVRAVARHRPIPNSSITPAQ
jgi:hypothetical protein